ncbi:alpha/beta hydrolase family protein [Nocardia sp. NPDC057030]|uniref:alpha/beta hydrolase family protein n=1 Tax=unclassified Nocardia TaxID=2637762 RepID=UPI003635F74E
MTTVEGGVHSVWRMFFRLMLVVSVGLLAAVVAGCGGVARTDTSVRSSALTISFGDFVSKGEVTYPAGARPAPLVVLVGGSGPEDLNADDASVGATSRGHLFADISSSLARQGFAVLRYNKHYVNGLGDVDPRFGTELTMTQLVDDVRSAVGAVANDPRIDARRVYLFGWSEGTTVVAAAANGMPNLRGVIVQGAVGIPWREGLIAQWERVVRPYLRDFAVAGSVGAAELNRASNGDGGVVAHELVSVLADDIGSERSALNPAFDTDGNGRIDIDNELPAAAVKFVDEQLAGGIFRLYGEPATLSDVAARAADLRDIPFLALHGENDSNVSVDAAVRIDKALADNGSRDHTLRVYPRSGHSLSAAADPRHDPIGPIQPQPLADLGRWLRDHEQR